MAGLFGCACGWSPAATAITVVALGTSLPDTFASKTAAQQDPYADASIGNITGSNSVNVFLGLGMSWITASIYWAFVGPTKDWKATIRELPGDLVSKYPEGGFIVYRGSLVFSVAVFCCCAMVCLGVLVARHRYIG